MGASRQEASFRLKEKATLSHFILLVKEPEQQVNLIVAKYLKNTK